MELLAKCSIRYRLTLLPNLCRRYSKSYSSTYLLIGGIGQHPNTTKGENKMKPTQKIEKMSDRELLRVNSFVMNFQCRSIHCEECLFSDDVGTCYTSLIFNEGCRRGLFRSPARKEKKS